MAEVDQEARIPDKVEPGEYRKGAFIPVPSVKGRNKLIGKLVGIIRRLTNRPPLTMGL